MTKRIHQKEFKRVETKYLMNRNQLHDLLLDLERQMEADDFAQSTITSLYFDTQNFDMIQDSLAKKYGKEKLRLRTYDEKPNHDSSAFLEIKQKMNGIGYKYRVKTTPQMATETLAIQDSSLNLDDRMAGQLEVLKSRYGAIGPRMLICYKRLSFKGKNNPNIRVTIDTNVNYTPVNTLTLSHPENQPLLPEDQLIMEIKVDEHLPSWLQTILETYALEKTSFSKYGRAYQLYQTNGLTKEIHYA